MQAAARTSDPNPQAGFTIVEVILSVVIMAIVFMAAFGSYFLGMDMVENARQEVLASQIIQSEIERLRTRNWDQLTRLPTDTYVPIPADFLEKFPGGCTLKREIRTLNSNQRTAVLIVSWRDSRGMEKVQHFATTFTRNGLNDYYYRDI